MVSHISWLDFKCQCEQCGLTREKACQAFSEYTAGQPLHEPGLIELLSRYIEPVDVTLHRGARDTVAMEETAQTSTVGLPATGRCGFEAGSVCLNGNTFCSRVQTC